jgi:ethanolamine utilization cobalamin adenosyltransferase
MSRTLITKQNYREFLDPGEKSITLCTKMILTPGAKDFLREQNIKIKYEDQVTEIPVNESVVKKEEKTLTDRIYQILKDEFKTDDCNLAEKIANLISIK